MAQITDPTPDWGDKGESRKLDNPTYPVDVRKLSVVGRAQWLLKKPLPQDETQMLAQVMFGRMVIEELVERIKTLESMGDFRV